MEIAGQKPEKTDAKPGTPIIVSDQPTTPLGGTEPTENKSQGSQDRIAAAKAKIGKPAQAATPAATQTATAAAGDKPKELTDEAIAAAEAKSKEQAEARAAVVTTEDDFPSKAAKAAEAAKSGDALKALEILGIPLDAAVRQATGSPQTTTAEDELKKENERLKAENEKIKRDGEQREATARAEASYHATVAAIVTDTAFPNITKADQVKEALDGAKAAYAGLKADLGRDLNEAEKDRLVRHYLKRYNDRAVSSEKPATPANEQASAKGGTVVPARPGKRSVAQVKADILSGKGKHN